MKSRFNPLAFVVVTLSAVAVPTQAGILYWDGTSIDGDANGGNGNWDTVLTNWDDAATSGLAIAWPSSGTDNDAVFGGTAGTVTVEALGVTANDLAFSTASYIIQGGKITLNGTTPTISNAVAATINSEFGGTVGLTKTGAGTLTLGAANTYTGTTTIAGGTLTLSGGNNRLATAGIIGFSADGTLDLGGNFQTVSNLTILTASANTKGMLTNGSLTLDGANALTITPSVTTGGRTAEIDASGLSSLTISKSGQTITVGGLAGGTSPGNYGVFKLSAVSNTITSSSINIGTTGGFNASGVLNSGRLELGASNTINANTWKLGTTRDGGIVQFQTGLTTPTVTLRGQNSTLESPVAVTSIVIGENAAGGTGVGTSHMNFSGGSVDILVGTLTLSRGGSSSTTAAGPGVNGSFSMGSGTLTATNIWLSKNEGGGLNGASSGQSNTSSFTQGGGTVKVSTLTFGETTKTTGTVLPVFNSQYTLNAGTLNAGSISAGTGVFATTSIRRINFNGGTISTLDADTNLTINGVTGTGGSIGLVLGTAGSPTFDAPTARTITLGGFTALSGSGSLTKTGAGILAINSAAAYTGTTTINGGTVSLAGGANRLPTGTDLTLANTAGVLLDLNGNNQTIGSLAGGGTHGGNISLGTGILKIGNANNTIFAGQLSGTGSLVKVGAGSLTLSGNTTASLAGMNISGGTLEITSGNYTVTGSAGTSAPDGTTGFVVSRGGTFHLNGGNVTASGGSYVFTAGNTGGGGNGFILDSGTFDGGNREVLNSFGGSGTFTMNGGLFIGGEFRISQSATGTVNLNGGVLRVVNLKHANATADVNFDGGTLQAKVNHTDFITTGVTAVNIKSGGAVIDSNGFNVAIPKALTEDNTSTGGGLTKIGNGTLTLSGANTYSGGTTVAAGTLLVNNSTGSGTGTGAVNVTGTALGSIVATLGGTGTIDGEVTIGALGKLSPTAQASGSKLSLGSTLAFDSGGTSIFNWDLSAEDTDPVNKTEQGNYGQVAVTGAASNTAIFNISLLGGTGKTSSYADAFWDTDKSWNNVFASSGMTDLSTLFTSFSGTGLTATGTATGRGSFGFTGTTLNWTAVPEPTSALAGVLLGFGLLRRRR